MIEFVHVSKVYPNQVVGLDDIDLTIKDGEFVSIIGLSGAGKSTLLRCINRLIDVTSGDVKVDGLSITKATKKQLRQIRRHIGMIFQQFNLVKRCSVLENVLSGRLGYYSTVKSLFALFTKEDYQNAYQILEQLGLKDKAFRRCDELSGGQQQRVMIARALVQQASTILADEPVASLDPVTALKVMQDLKNINEKLNKTVIVNIHSVELAKQFSTRIIALQKGKVVFDGTPSQLDDTQLEMIYGKA